MQKALDIEQAHGEARLVRPGELEANYDERGRRARAHGPKQFRKGGAEVVLVVGEYGII